MSVARLYKVGTPYNGVELSEVDFEQSADTMYLAHINHAPEKLVRAGHTDWRFSAIPFGPTLLPPTDLGITVNNPNVDAGNAGNAYFPLDATYAVTSIDDTTGQESRASVTVTGTNDLGLKRNSNVLNWTAAASATRYRVFKANVSGSLGYIGQTKPATADTPSPTTFTDNNIGPDFTDGPPTGNNPFATAGDYPSTVTFHEQRLLWARTTNHPNAIYGSRSSDYENMDISRPLKASDAITIGLVAGRVNAVNQLASVTTLLALSSDAVFKISDGAEGFITPTNIVSRRENGRGSARLGPLVIDTVVFYKQAVGCVVRSVGYSFEKDGYPTNDVTIYSPHLFLGFDIVSWAYAQEPRSLIWAVRSDGALLCFTWQEEQQVWGWTLCETDGLVQSVCAISEAGEDRLYLTVQRLINGVSRTFIERMAASRWDDQIECCFLDCARSYTFDTPTAVLRNLGHLEGRTVSALVDGNVVTDIIVSGGIATLPNAASDVTIGIPFTAEIETLPLAIQGPRGWTIAQPQQATKAVIQVIDTRGLLVGPTADDLEILKPRRLEMLAAPNDLQNGPYEITMRPYTSGGAQVVVQSVDPLPMTIVGIYLDPSIPG